MRKTDSRSEAMEKTTKTASVGAGAGVGVAALIGGPVLLCGLAGGGLACLGAGIMDLLDD